MAAEDEDASWIDECYSGGDANNAAELELDAAGNVVLYRPVGSTELD